MRSPSSALVGAPRRFPKRTGAGCCDGAARAADRRFLSAVSHDLRTPLAVIVGYAELIGEREDEATRREGAARIMEAAERLSEGIENVVALFETGAAHGAGAVPFGRRRPSAIGCARSSVWTATKLSAISS